MVKRYSCLICGNKVEESLTTRSSKKQAHNTVFLAALKINTSCPQELLELYFETFAQKQKYICITHFINAAQYLLAEVMVSGGHLSRTADVSYITEKDIPEHLLMSINAAKESFSANIPVTAKDVVQYINFYMQKYFGRKGWNRLNANFPEEEETDSEDLRTNLCIHTEVVHCSETANISGRMEREGFRRMLRWLRSNDIPINSIATDRSAMYGSEIASFNDEFDECVEWFFDPWHLGRYLYKNLRAAAKPKDCASIKDWVEDIENHLYYSIAVGAASNSGELIRHVFNTCLHHVANVHQFDKDDITGPLTSCLHDPIEPDEEREKPTIDLGSVAHTKLKQVVLQAAFQEALAQASPHGGTSLCESKNSLDRLYCPK